MKKLFFTIRVLLSIIILFFVLKKLDLRNIPSIPINYLALIILLYGVQFLIMVYKWLLFLGKKSFIYAAKIYWASDFLNFFGLGVVASEVYKTFSFKNKKKALTASLTDRVLSLWWYLSIGIILFVLSFHTIYGIISGAIVVLLTVLGFWLLRKFSFTAFIPLSNYIKHAVSGMLLYAVKFLIYFVLFSSLMPLSHIFVMIPIVMIAISLPISINGIGIREYIVYQYGVIMAFNTTFLVSGALLLSVIDVGYKVLGSIPFVMQHKSQEIH